MSTIIWKLFDISLKEAFTELSSVAISTLTRSLNLSASDLKAAVLSDNLDKVLQSRSIIFLEIFTFVSIRCPVTLNDQVLSDAIYKAIEEFEPYLNIIKFENPELNYIKSSFPQQLKIDHLIYFPGQKKHLVRKNRIILALQTAFVLYLMINDKYTKSIIYDKNEFERIFPEFFCKNDSSDCLKIFPPSYRRKFRKGINDIELSKLMKTYNMMTVLAGFSRIPKLGEFIDLSVCCVEGENVNYVNGGGATGSTMRRKFLFYRVVEKFYSKNVQQKKIQSKFESYPSLTTPPVKRRGAIQVGNNAKRFKLNNDHIEPTNNNKPGIIDDKKPEFVFDNKTNENIESNQNKNYDYFLINKRENDLFDDVLSLDINISAQNSFDGI